MRGAGPGRAQCTCELVAGAGTSDEGSFRAGGRGPRVCRSSEVRPPGHGMSGGCTDLGRGRRQVGTTRAHGGPARDRSAVHASGPAGLRRRRELCSLCSRNVTGSWPAVGGRPGEPGRRSPLCGEVEAGNRQARADLFRGGGYRRAGWPARRRQPLRRRTSRGHRPGPPRRLRCRTRRRTSARSPSGPARARRRWWSPAR